MLTNTRSDRVRSVRALSRRAVRERTGRFVADGPQSVREAVRWAAGSVDDLYVTPEAWDTPGKVTKVDEVERWCVSCLTHYPHEETAEA